VYEGLIRVQGTATRIACTRMTAQHLEALSDSIERSSRPPARSGWERQAAAHTEIFRLLADVAGDPVVAAVLNVGAGCLRDLLLTVGPAADDMIVSSRRRLLEHVRGGDADGAAREMEDHLRSLHSMGHLGRRSSPGTLT
jgi:GntR family transcriptional regulator, transcriptional repressor for pyruvate dehydrogenase complex